MLESGPHRLPPWPAEDHACGDCRVAYSEQSFARASAEIAQVPAAVREMLADLPDGARRWRPAPDAWSATEYVCHVRDVYMTYTIRLHRARTEHEPQLEPMLNDLRARRFRYNQRDVDSVLDEVEAAAAGFGEESARNSDSDLRRLVTRLPGEHRTALWLVRQAWHEGNHHARDIRNAARQARDALGLPDV